MEVEGQSADDAYRRYPGRYDLRALRLIWSTAPICSSAATRILRVINEHYNMLTLNPGAAGIQGFHLVRTALRFHISDGKIHDMEVGEWEKFY